MNRFLMALLLLGMLAWMSLGGYYFFVIKPRTPVSLPTPLSGTSPSTAWIDMRAVIAKDCKEVAFDTAKDVNYIMKLADGIGGVTIDPTDNSFTTVDDTKQISIQAVAKNGGIPVTGGINCWTVWVGDANGSGKVAYETTNGEVKTLQVTGFPITPPPAEPPAGE